MPLVRGTAFQQSAAPSQIWRYLEQLVLMPLPPYLHSGPPSPLGAAPMPPGSPLHLPMVEPGARMQVPPGQQSALMVQVSPVRWHTSPPQRRTPFASGTQGRSSQQSSLEAH